MGVGKVGHVLVETFSHVVGDIQHVWVGVGKANKGESEADVN